MKFVLIIFILLLVAMPVSAQWQYGGKEISGRNYPVADFTTISDGTGGVFVAWRYYPEPGNPDIFVQHVDSAGYESWQHEGVDAVIEPHGQYHPYLVAVGDGGVIVGWSDIGRFQGDYDIFTQRLNSYGERLWGDSGHAVVVRDGHQFLSGMATDNEGGAIFIWSDEYLPYSDTMPVMIQRVDSSGVLYFDEYGRGLTPLQGYRQHGISLFNSPDSTLIACWGDDRPFGAGPGIYAQKFTNDGELIWDSVGIPVAVYPYSLEEISYEPSRSGGFYALWSGNLSRGVFVQYVNEYGQARFGPAGYTLSNYWYCYDPKLKLAENDLVLAGWMSQLGTDTIFANLLDTLGNRWPENRRIGINTGGLYSLIKSGPEEFVFSSSTGSPNFDYRALKYSLAMGHLWGDTGIAIGLPHYQGYRHYGISDMAGGSFFVWQYLEGYPVFINRVYQNGWVAPDTTDVVWDDVTLPHAINISNYPNPFNSSTLITFKGLTGEEVELRIYDIEGRLVDRINTHEGQIIWSARNSDNQPLPSGLYFAKISTPLVLPILKMLYLK